MKGEDPMSDKLLGWISAAFDLPSESVSGRLLVELVEDRRLLVENHHGIVSYDRDCIIIKTGVGRLLISGGELTMVQMTRERIIITGRVEQIMLQKEV